MAQPQPGIILEPNQSALFVVCRVPNAKIDGQRIARVAAGIPSLVDTIGTIDRAAELVCTASFGAAFWNFLSPAERPAALRPFTAVHTAGRAAPSTGGDLLLHIISKRMDLNMEFGLRAMAQFGQAVEVTDAVHGFRYLDSRDLTGFIDGTENPRGSAERAAVALIGQEDPTFAGGSYVFTQRYVHDLNKWATRAVQEQEQIIGRRKADSEELTGDRTRPTAHISRVGIEENGKDLQIVRHSFPYGTPAGAGLFFIAYTRDLAIPEKMLARMMGRSGDGLHDHLMDYTQAVSGATFFAPSLDMLGSLA
ncbi:MAG: Dyp-type peroxidase [Candidatus Binatia bacterium]